MGTQTVNVLIDDQIFLMHARGGISRYFAELIREFRAHPEWGIRALTSVRRSPNQHLRDVDPRVRDLGFPEQSFSWKVAKRFAAYPSAFAARGLRPDVVHYTYYDPRKLALFRGVPKVVTIHDMVPELLPADLVDGNPHMAKRAYVEHADAIICVSEATRDDLFAVWGEITDIPVIVTGHATSERFHRDVRPAWLGFEYLLYVGSRDHYKNFRTLLTAYAASWAPTAGVRLVAVGGGDFTAAERAEMEALEVTELVVQSTVAEADLPGYYRGAAAFIFPSLSEGFGIPVLEAMSVGTPTVLSDLKVFREVAGDAAMFFPAGDAAALTACIDRLLGDPPLREQLRTAGLARAAQYSWEATAHTTAELYRQLVAEHS